MTFTRRQLLKYGAGAGVALYIPWEIRSLQAIAAPETVPGLAATDIPKYQQPLIIPPAMPPSPAPPNAARRSVEYYEIAVRQFDQQILPPPLPETTVWSYGAARAPGTVFDGGSFHYPAFTIEASYAKPVRVKWINDLVDSDGNYLPHLLPVDQTLHWANPPGGPQGRDGHGMDPTPYTGPVPIVTHLHGGHSTQESDGFAEAWYLPHAKNIPPGFARVGSFYRRFRARAQAALGQAWTPGNAVFEYDNDQRASTLWYHDHTLGMTRANVYAGPAGFYLLRGGPGDEVKDGKTGDPAVLPGPAPKLGDPAGTKYYEIPLAIQDRSFNEDGSLFYPDNRAYFEGLDQSQLQIPFIPEEACGGPSDISPIWNPEFFGDAIVVNGRTWPFLEVEQRRYRFRLLNGSNSRFLALRFDHPDADVWQIGTEGGFLPAPVRINDLDVQGVGPVILLAPAERADVIVDFANVPQGSFRLLNVAPDEPFGGFPAEPANADTTGQVMEFRVVPSSSPDPTTSPNDLVLPEIPPIPAATNTRQVSLNEESSRTVFVTEDAEGNIVLDCANGEAFGPAEADLGTLNPDGTGRSLGWDEPMTENPAVGATEVWEMHNFTQDAHPIHIHEVMFEVIDREALEGGSAQPLQPWEIGARKDTVIAYPGEVTSVRATFDRAGLFVWHCHIVEHEDNEMMRPYLIGPPSPGSSPAPSAKRRRRRRRRRRGARGRQVGMASGFRSRRRR